jgi:2-amino-4-hydroxy-6-hydroxymethyldihydropteridine diphosphokinase
VSDSDPHTVTTEFAWLALGSNLGHRGRHLACLRQALAAAALEVVAASPEILTRPVGVTGQGDFHNQVLLVRAPAPEDAAAWLGRCKTAERQCGRRETYRWGPRSVDCDLLLLGRDGSLAHAGDPEVPHPEVRNRAYIGRLLATIDQNLAARISA